MAFSFDGPNKRINISSATTISLRDLWSRWVDWLLTSDNSKYEFAFSQVGGNDIDLSAGTYIPIYLFLLNGWRIKPQESDHTLAVQDGIVVVDGGGDPFVNTSGSYVVRINYQQPVQAIAFSTSGSSGPTAGAIADAVWAHASATSSMTKLEMIEKILRNKSITDPNTGEFVLYDNNGTDELFRVPLWEDAGASQSYRGQGAERRERLE